MEMIEENKACGNLNSLQDENSVQKNNSSNECNLQNITTESSKIIVQTDQKELQAIDEMTQNSIKKETDEELKSSKETTECEKYFKRKRTMSEGSGEKLENSLPADEIDLEIEKEEYRKELSSKCNVNGKKEMSEEKNSLEGFGQEIVKIDSNQHAPIKQGTAEEFESSKENTECEKNFKRKRTGSDEKLENSLLEDEMDSKMAIEEENNSKEEISSKCNENGEKEGSSKDELSSKCDKNCSSLTDGEMDSKIEIEQENNNKDELSYKCDENSNSLTEGKINSKMEEEKKDNSKEQLSSKCDENSKPVKKEMAKEKNSHKANEFANYFDIKIPLIGRPMKLTDSKPLGKRYDLAMEINRRRAAYNKKMGYDKFIPRQRPWEMKAKTEEEQKEEAARKLQVTVSIATYISRICLRILNELNKDTYEESKVIKHFEKFLIGPATPTALLYVPHFVHFIMWCRKNKEFSKRIRALATKAYDRCRVMFPIPDGYNFITVYMQQVKNFVPDDFETLETSIPLLHSINVIPDCDIKSDADKMLDTESNSRNL